MSGRLIFTIVLVSIGFATARLLGVRGDIYKDFAHVWIGAMLATWYLGWADGRGDDDAKHVGGIMFVILCVVELFAAFVLYPIGAK